MLARTIAAAAEPPRMGAPFADGHRIVLAAAIHEPSRRASPADTALHGAPACSHCPPVPRDPPPPHTLLRRNHLRTETRRTTQSVVSPRCDVLPVWRRRRVAARTWNGRQICDHRLWQEGVVHDGVRICWSLSHFFQFFN